MTYQFTLEVVSAMFGLVGALLMAMKCRHSGVAWVFWLFSSVGWIAFGVWNEHWFLVAQSVGFTVSNLIGVWVWLVRPALTPVSDF